MTKAEELQALKEQYGHYNINVIFATLQGYRDVRSYTSFKEVKQEIEKIL